MQGLTASTASLRKAGHRGGALWLLQVFALGAGFLLHFLLVRMLPTAIYGGYVYLLALLQLLLGISLLGMDTLVLRFSAMYRSMAQLSLLRGLLSTAAIAVILSSAIATGLAALSGKPQPGTGLATGAWLSIAFACLCLMGLNAVLQAHLQATGKPVQGQLAERLVKPLLLLGGAALVYWLIPDAGVLHLGMLLLAALGAVFLLNLYLVFRGGLQHLQGVKAQFDRSAWTKVAGTVWLMAIVYAANSRVDVLVLGQVRGASALAVYNIAARLSELTALPLTVANYLLAPQVARLHQSGSLAQLQQLATRSAKRAAAAGLPLLLLFGLFREPLLGIFGPAYQTGADAFLVLLAGQAANLVAGCVGTLLLMSGYQRYALLSLLCSLCLNLAGNWLLVPRLGIIGTAVATTAGLVCWNLLMYIFVRKKLKIKASALGFA